MHRDMLFVAILLGSLSGVLSRPGDVTPLISDVTEEQQRSLREIWGVRDDVDLPIPLIFPGKASWRNSSAPQAFSQVERMLMLNTVISASFC